MDSSTLGRSDLRPPPVIFGAMARQQQTDSERIDILQAAIELGFTTLDTAPLYDFGAAERQIAMALRDQSRLQVHVYTKAGLRWEGDKHGEVLFTFTDPSGKQGAVRRNSRPESICWEVEASLTRLQLDCLELVQLHQPDELTPINETMGALLDLRAAGKVRHIGVSNFSPAQVKAAQQALGDVPLACVQADYSLANQSFARTHLPHCIEQQIGVLAYSPLAGGMLTGTKPAQTPTPVQRAIQQTLQPVAETHCVPAAVVAMAWVRAQTGVNAAICGASSVAQISALAPALTLRLDPHEQQTLTTAFARATRRPLVGRIAGRLKRYAKRALGRR
ncbi:MAG: aldo/keto reductase [Pseudomonadales bacterium]